LWFNFCSAGWIASFGVGLSQLWITARTREAGSVEGRGEKGGKEVRVPVMPLLLVSVVVSAWTTGCKMTMLVWGVCV